MEKQTYNGWTNYETWQVALWLDNDGYLESCREDKTKVTADTIKDHVWDSNPLADENSLFSDIINATLQEVDWDEIADNFNEDNDAESEE